MNKYTIPIIGLIASKEDTEEGEPNFGMTDLLFHLSLAKDFSAIELQFNSPGGFCDVADKMIAVLSRIEKPLFSSNSGQVCSAASKIFTVAPKENRTYDPTKGVFLIHNPWGQIEGDASELAQASKELMSTENEYAKWYSEKTGSDVEIIKGFMSENAPLTAEQVEGLGFATIIKPTVSAIAFLNSKFNQNKMNKTDFEQKLNAFEKFLAKFKSKAFVLNDVNGKEIEFPEINDISELKVGAKTTAPDGEYVLPDGSILVASGNLITEIKPATTEAAPDDIAALKAEIEALKAENATLKSESLVALSDAEKSVSEVKAEFKKFRAQFTDVNFSNDTPPAVLTPKKGFSKDDFVKSLNLK